MDGLIGYSMVLDLDTSSCFQCGEKSFAEALLLCWCPEEQGHVESGGIGSHFLRWKWEDCNLEMRLSWFDGSVCISHYLPSQINTLCFRNSLPCPPELLFSDAFDDLFYGMSIAGLNS